MNDLPRTDAALRVDPDSHLTYLMAKVGHILEQRLDQSLRELGLTLRQFSALAHIAARPGMSAADLARALLTSPQAVNTLVQRLLAAGLIERADGPARQPRALTLSPAGVDALRRAAPLATATEAQALDHADPDDLVHTRRALEDLRRALGTDDEP